MATQMIIMNSERIIIMNTLLCNNMYAVYIFNPLHGHMTHIQVYRRGHVCTGTYVHVHVCTWGFVWGRGR